MKESSIETSMHAYGPARVCVVLKLTWSLLTFLGYLLPDSNADLRHNVVQTPPVCLVM